MSRPRLDTPKFRLIKREGIYYSRWWQDGRWHRRSLHTKDADQAMEHLAQFTKAVPNPGHSIVAWGSSSKSTHRGLLSETKVLLRLLEIGAEAFIPWGHDHRMDLIAAVGAKLCRIQVKTARLSHGRLTVGAYTRNYRLGRLTKVTLLPEECDWLVAYSPQRDQCYATKVTGSAQYDLTGELPLTTLAQLFGPGIGAG